jgi:hypothetical protein
MERDIEIREKKIEKEDKSKRYKKYIKYLLFHTTINSLK